MFRRNKIIYNHEVIRAYLPIYGALPPRLRDVTSQFTGRHLPIYGATHPCLRDKNFSMMNPKVKFKTTPYSNLM